MFTGLIMLRGTVTGVTPAEGSVRIGIRVDPEGEPLRAGESIAVDGVCLTAASVTSDGFEADVIAETLSRTTLGGLGPGSRVNLERSLRLTDRLGGHLVQGHVDGTARVRSVRSRGDDYRIRVETPPELRRFLPFKGSVALQGVSLTIAAVGEDWFDVALIPETLSRTNLSTLREGERVNVEVDLLARYLEKLLKERDLPDGEG